MTMAAENNFLLPNGTFIVELILFAIIFGVLAKWVFPAVNRATDERRERIRRRLAEGEQARAEAEATEREYHEAVQQMRAEVAALRDEARAQGKQVVAEARATAQEEAERVARGEQEHLAAQREQIMRQLRAEVGQFAADLSGKIVGEPVHAEQQRVVSGFLAGGEGAGDDAAGGDGAQAQPAGRRVSRR